MLGCGDSEPMEENGMSATLTYRRLRPEAPVGLLVNACLEFHPRRVACARCVENCPAEVLSFTREGLRLDDGCLGCGRCMAVCPTGALAVHGFSLTLTPEPTLDTLALDCWKVPGHLSPPASVRVPCLGGLSVSQLLALRYVAGSRRFALLDRGWCSQCAAGRHDIHPAQAALSATRDWLEEIGAPESHWPTLDKRPLAVSYQCQTLSDDAVSSPAKRHDFLSRLAREVATTVNEVATFRIEENPAGVPRRPVQDQEPLQAIEREHQLLLLELLAARYGGSLPARFFPVVEIGPNCRDHRLCVDHCPTGALRTCQDINDSGVLFDSAICIACGQCQMICPEQAIHVRPQPGHDDARAKPVTPARRARQTCLKCGGTFSPNGREKHDLTCHKLKELADAALKSSLRNISDREAVQEKWRGDAPATEPTNQCNGCGSRDGDGRNK
jgi:Fe-S-cluster-containing hydrogenase component 2